MSRDPRPCARSARRASQREPVLTSEIDAPRTGMWRNRASAFAIVISFMIVSGGFSASGNVDRRWFDLVVVPIGYTHLIGALWFSQRHAPIGRYTLVLVGSSVFTALCVYAWALQGSTRVWCLGAILFVSMWHTIENDLMLGRAYENGLRITPLSRGARAHALTFSGAASLGILALATPDGALLSNSQRGLALPVVFASLDHVAIAGILYHLASWAIFLIDRSRSLPTRVSQAVRRRLFLIHAAPLVFNAIVWACFPLGHFYLASLPLYLFWSAAHALHTAWVRGVEAA